MTGAHAPQAYDRDKLVELFGDDPATLAEVEREFLETARVAEREIKETDDFTAIARAAHRLKGASGMIGAASLRQIAEAVERAAKAERPADRAPPARDVQPRSAPGRRAGGGCRRVAGGARLQSRVIAGSQSGFRKREIITPHPEEPREARRLEGLILRSRAKRGVSKPHPEGSRAKRGRLEASS